MIRGRRTLRLTAVAALVVLALTGFSRGHGRHHSSSGGGGGCSSSSQDHDSSSHSTSGGSSYGGSTYDDDPVTTPTVRHRNRSTPTSTSSGTALQEGTARLVSCASASRPWSTVEVTNPNGRQVTFTVSTTYYDDADLRIETRTAKVRVPGQGRAVAKVPVGTASGAVDRVDHCEVDPAARP
ncbi:hypothetical protein ABT127_25430 [Streptomyces sp. NPDC001904]|uniref:hypothetical protein n=1 Tax=Streptomyces sp. NPDC001904 TaxID=3154531 RepID=UPI00333426EE